MSFDSLPYKRDVILDSINEGVFTVGLDMRITEFNRSAERITGTPRREAIGKSCFEVFHADICKNNCALNQTFKSGHPIFNVTTCIINHLGCRVPIRISTAILKDDQGHVVGGVETFQDLSQIEQLQKALQNRYTFEDIVGHSPSMVRLFEILPQIAQSNSTVLIEGASGTGKELFARAIHHLSPRRKKRFIPVNCAALPDTLLESELFGHKAGAFTDARKDKAGRFLLADGGTIFLDEICDISPALQVRLLRVLQDHIIEPLGSVDSIHVDTRIVAAAKKNLSELVQSGKFREDLYYRIRVIHLLLPSLKERRDDIPLLIDHLVAKFNRLQDKDIAVVSAEALACLMKHDFPGNVRELENIIEQAFVLCRSSVIELHHLPSEFNSQAFFAKEAFTPLNLQAAERLFISEGLRRYKGNRKRVAEELGVHTSTLYRKIKALKIEAPKTDGRSQKQ